MHFNPLRQWVLLVMVFTLLLAACQQEKEPAPTNNPDQAGTPATETGTGTGAGASSPTTTTPATTSPTPHPYITLEDEILVLINQHRAARGLSALSKNDVTLDESRLHSQNMASGQVAFGHDGFVERANRIINLIGGTGAAENVANGYTTAQTVVNGWLNSAGHRTNIEGNYRLTGIGVARSTDGTYYYTQIFIQ